MLDVLCIRLCCCDDKVTENTLCVYVVFYCGNVYNFNWVYYNDDDWWLILIDIYVIMDFIMELK